MDAKTADARTHEFDVQDVEYLRHGDKPLLARVFKPRGDGPFPAIVDLHGGAWCQSNRLSDKLRHELLAGHGNVVVSLDWRCGSEGAYPKALTDINYAIRWVKAHAKELKTRPDLVAISGQSSGGHLAMLAAMRPHDPRYTAIPLPAGSPKVDATVKCVIMSWPVINPIGRYNYAKRQGAMNPPAAWAPDIIGRHNQFWGNEANMTEASPMLMLERGEKVDAAAGDLAPGPRRHDARLQGRGLTRAPKPRRRALPPTTRRPAATSSLTYFDSDRKPGQSPDLTNIGDTFERMLGFIGKHLKR